MRLEVLLVVRFREVRVARIAPSDPACGQSGSGSRVMQASSGVACRRQSATAAVAFELTPPARGVVAFDTRHGPQPSVPRLESHERRRVRPCERLGVEAKVPRVGDARRSSGPAPQSQPVAPAPRLAALSRRLVAFGLGLRMLAAGPAQVQVYSFSSGSGHRRTSALRATSGRRRSSPARARLDDDPACRMLARGLS